MSADASKQSLPKLAQTTLPNGMVFACTDTREPQFIYKEIFEDNLYLRHGVKIPKDAVVFDVGANIGMFAAYIAKIYPDAKVFSFEPLPPIYAALKANIERNMTPKVKAFNVGLSKEPSQATFSFYPLAAGWSTMYPNDTPQYREQMKDNLKGNPDVPWYGRAALATPLLGPIVANIIVNTQLKHTDYPCTLKTLSSVLREEGVTRVDLLKIDVERAELDVLRGIEDADWPKIAQVSAEVQSDQNKAQLDEFVGLLKSKGFTVHVEDINVLKAKDGTSPNASVYAVR